MTTRLPVLPLATLLIVVAGLAGAAAAAGQPELIPAVIVAGVLGLMALPPAGDGRATTVPALRSTPATAFAAAGRSSARRAASC